MAAGIEQIIFMGGSVSRRMAEFNVWQDPEAAAYLIESSIPIFMYGLDIFERLLVEQSCIDHLRAHDHPAIRLTGQLLQRRSGHKESNQGKVGLLGDAGALVLMTNPELFLIEERPVRIELEGRNRGQAVVGQEANVNEWPRVRVALDLDVTKAASAFVETIHSYAA